MNWYSLFGGRAYNCRECIFRYFSFWLGHGFVSDFCKGGLFNSVCLLYKKLAIWLLSNWQRFSDLTFLIVCVRVAFSPFNQQKQNIRGKVIIWFCLGTEARGNFLSRAFFRTCIPNLLKFLLFINWVKSGITPDKVPHGFSFRFKLWSLNNWTVDGKFLSDFLWENRLYIVRQTVHW